MLYAIPVFLIILGIIFGGAYLHTLWDRHVEEPNEAARQERIMAHRRKIRRRR